MGKKVVKTLIVIILISVLLQHVTTALAARDGSSDQKKYALQQVYAVYPDSNHMVNEAVTVLSKGWSGMSQEQRQVFLRYYDPGEDGGIDDRYVEEVLDNYLKIQAKLESGLIYAYAPNSSKCVLRTLYYTDFFRVHLCPSLLVEENEVKIARDLVHEVAHIALRAFDRPYYYPNFSPYEKLTPRGHWSARLPVIGSILRELMRRDTLYHPDAYAKYAAELVSGEKNAPVAGQSAETQDESVERQLYSQADASDQKLLALANAAR